MLRRDFLHQLATACAGTPLALSVAACSQSPSPVPASPELDQQNTRRFIRERLPMITVLAEGIIPATDTPGAEGAGVPAFLALLYSEWFLPEQQTRFENGLHALNADTQHHHGSSFLQLSPEERSHMLLKWDDEAFQTSPKSASAEFFSWFKKLTVIGYYTSEVGQLEELKARFGAGQNTAAGPILEPPPFRT